jgi:hypothetical protein
MTGLELIKAIRNMTFVGAVLGGLSVLIYPFLPEHVTKLVSVETLFVYVSFLGGCIQFGLSGAFKSITPPILKFMSFYENLTELYFLIKASRVRPELAQEIIDILTFQRFLGEKAKVPARLQVKPKPKELESKT